MWAVHGQLSLIAFIINHKYYCNYGITIITIIVVIIIITDIIYY